MKITTLISSNTLIYILVISSVYVKKMFPRCWEVLGCESARRVLNISREAFKVVMFVLLKEKPSVTQMPGKHSYLV